MKTPNLDRLRSGEFLSHTRDCTMRGGQCPCGLDALRDGANGEAEAMQSKLAVLGEANAVLREDLSSLRSANAELRGEVEELRGKLHAATEWMVANHTERTRLAARVAALEKALRGLVESVTAYGEPRCAGASMLYSPQIGAEQIKAARALLTQEARKETE